MKISNAQTACFVLTLSSQVGESCPPNALRPLPSPPTPASQHLSQNETIQWLLLHSPTPSPGVLYRDYWVCMHSVECKILHVRFVVGFNRIFFWESASVNIIRRAETAWLWRWKVNNKLWQNRVSLKGIYVWGVNSTVSKHSHHFVWKETSERVARRCDDTVDKEQLNSCILKHLVRREINNQKNG